MDEEKEIKEDGKKEIGEGRENEGQVGRRTAEEGKGKHITTGEGTQKEGRTIRRRRRERGDKVNGKSQLKTREVTQLETEKKQEKEKGNMNVLRMGLSNYIRNILQGVLCDMKRKVIV